MLAPGFLLQDRYEIICSIGQGGMGAVFRAIDRRLGHSVAVKQIMHSDSALRAAFEREARLLAALDHPVLPKVTDHFIEPAGQFLVMAYIPGDDLATIVQRQRQALPIADVLQWAHQLLDGLTYLQAQHPPVVHRDIKPQNLKLDERGNIILLDFGLAKGALDQNITERSLAGYTLSYAAPEQLRGEPTNAKSDLFSLGATLYMLLSGNKPIDALRRLAAVAAGHPDPLPSLQTVNPDLPPSFALVVDRAVALLPEDRFADATDMRLALQAADDDSTFVPTGAQAATPTNNLPAQLTSFVGRDAEVAHVQQLLQRREARLITLTGPGGIGKTRLALSVATRSIGLFRNGIFFVSLSLIRDPGLVLPTIAQTLGVREVGGATVLQCMQNSLRDMDLLLLLDNFEQVVAAAPLIGELLSVCPQLVILVTSREALQIRGEQEFPVAGLEGPNQKQLPAPEALAQLAAIKLFVQRAQSVKPAFSLNSRNAHAIAEICRRLDGLPLAIELAAASTKFLTAPAILARLTERFDLLSGGARDVPERQRTLRASLDWSYDLLAGEHKTLFQRLSAFGGSFNLAAAEAVCARTGVPVRAVLPGIAALIDKSLVKAVEAADEEPRFTLLETIREFGLMQLAEAGESQRVRAAHADYYYRLAQEARNHLWGADIAEWVLRLDTESDNLRVALNYYLSQPDGAEAGLWMAGSLWRFWEIRGYATEGRTWLGPVLQRRGEAPLSSQWLALHAAGNLANGQGDYDTAKAHYLESLHVLQRLQALDDSRHTRNGIANTLLNLGNLALLQSDIEPALDYTAQSLALHRQIDNSVGMSLALNNLAQIKLSQSDYERAEQLSIEALAVYRELGDERGIAWNLRRLAAIARDRGDYGQAASLYSDCQRLSDKLASRIDSVVLLYDLGELARYQGDDDRAKTYYEQGLALAQELDSKVEIANLLDRLGVLACHSGDFEEAAMLNEQSYSIQQAVGNRVGQSDALHSRGDLRVAERKYQAAAADYRESLRLRAWLGARRRIVESLLALAALAVALSYPPAYTAQLLSAAEYLRSLIGMQIAPAQRQKVDQLASSLQETIGQQAFADAIAGANADNLECAIQLALQEQ